MASNIPEPYVTETVGNATLVSLPGAMDIVKEAVEAAGTLYEAAQVTPTAEPLRGRGTAYRIPTPMRDGVDWLVRHYRRGGALASILGDRYLRIGEPRPIQELGASVEARRRDIPTPEVIAAAVHPGPGFYRGDLITAFIPRSVTLADLLYRDPDGPAWEPLHGTLARTLEAEDGPTERERAVRRTRVAACRAAGAVVRLAQDRGLIHADLNLRNLLLQASGNGLFAYLVDLDRSRLVNGGVQSPTREQMIARFWRSAEKLEEASNRTLTDEERAAFDEGYVVGTRGNG